MAVVAGKGVMNTYLLASGAVMEKYQSASHLSSTDIHESLFESVFSSPDDATQLPTAMDSLLVTSCLLQVRILGAMWRRMTCKVVSDGPSMTVCL